MDCVRSELDRLSQLATSNAKYVSVLGARAIVLGKFLDATLPELTRLQREAVARSFRKGIEDALALMDDVPLPDEFLSPLLDTTNTVIRNLEDGASA